MGGVEESQHALGIHGLDTPELSMAGFVAVLNMGAGVTRPQTMVHATMHRTLVNAAVQAREKDFYVGTSLFASNRSRRKANLKSLRMFWVDLDAYDVRKTDEFIERLLARAYFAGIPHPSLIVDSGRGLYLKWFLDKSLPDTHLAEWQDVQDRLNKLFLDLGADFNAKDACRVLRVVDTVNSKVDPQGGNGRTGVVRVIWKSGRRHSFQSLHDPLHLIDDEAPMCNRKAGAKAAHQVGGPGPSGLILPPNARGDIAILQDYALARQPSFELEARSKAAGKGNGFSARTLPWYRWLDIRDLLLMRVQATGGTGVAEGSRDLTLLWMVNFLAQAGVVNSRNVYQEIDWLLQAFDGVGFPGERGFEHPRLSGALNTLIRRIKASEDGQRYRFAGSLWDPKYTPSNDYLINLFGITSDEMGAMRTLIDQNEKRVRSDKKVEGRAQRRSARHSWQSAALRARDEIATARQAGDEAVPERKECAAIAEKVGRPPKTVRAFLRRHDDKLALAAARIAGKAPPKVYKKAAAAEPGPEELLKREQLDEKLRHERLAASLRPNGYEGDGSPEDLRAWIAARQAFGRAQMERNAALVAEEARAKQEEGVRNLNEILGRVMRYGRGVPREPDSSACLPGGITQAAPQGVQGVSAPSLDTDRQGMAAPDDCSRRQAGDAPRSLTRVAEVMAETIFRKLHSLRENPPTIALAQETMNPLPSAESVDPSAGAERMVSKRALLEKARKAQKKGALPPSANDPSIAASVAPATVTGPASAAYIAKGVIPPDLLESSGDLASEPAGMPDLDDGYLDSFADGDEHAPREPPPSALHESPAAAAPVAPRTPPILAFSRGAMPGAPPSAPRGFGFNRPGLSPAPGVGAALAKSQNTSQAAAPAGLAFAGRPAAAPTKPLGFGAPQRLSPDQARVNGQRQDFAKFFEEPQFGDDGIPTTYPTRAVWPHDDLPAGSNYTHEEWESARAADEEFPAGHVVVELQVGNPVQSALIKVPRKAAPVTAAAAPPIARTAVVDGKIVKQDPYPGIDDPMADAIADTIVVSRKSPIAEEVRGAVEGGIETSRGGVSSYFRFIRPRSHYTDPDKFIYLNSKLQMSGSLGEVGARMAEPVDERTEATVATPEQEDAETAEAPRA